MHQSTSNINSIIKKRPSLLIIWCLYLNPQGHIPLFAAVLLLLRPIHFRGGRPGRPAWGFKEFLTHKYLSYYRVQQWKRLKLIRYSVLFRITFIQR